MVLKPTNKLLKLLLLIAYVAMAAFSTNASAAQVVIDFGTGLAGNGGTITDVNSDGSYIKGENILIGSLEAIGTTADGVYITDALLNFDTNSNIITIDGTVSVLGIGTSITLLTGSFNGWNYDDTGVTGAFSGNGIDIKHDDLLNALGVDLATQFDFFAFTLGFDFTGSNASTAVSTDIINTSVVPVPAAVWLFGSGLIGLAGVARRRV